MAFGECTGVMTDLAPICNVPKGLEQTVYILSRSAFNSAAVTYDTTGIYINGITLLAASGDRAYRAQQIPNMTKRAIESAIGDDGRIEFTPTITIQTPSDAAGVLVAEFLQNNEVVVFVEQKFKGTLNNAAFAAIGVTAGLKALPSIAEGSNEIIIPLAPSDNAKETVLSYFYTTNEAADTLAADRASLEALLTPA